MKGLADIDDLPELDPLPASWIRDEPVAPIADDQAPLLRWHGDAPPRPIEWQVEEVLPAHGVAILAGQSGVAKTFVGIDLSIAIMTGNSFAGCSTHSPGGVLWLAAEGENELELRLGGVIDGKLLPSYNDSVELDFDPRRMPFCWQAGAVPTLTEKNAKESLLRLAVHARKGILAEHGAALRMIVIDTLAAAAAFADENSSGETMAVMNLLRAVSVETGALVLVIDHFGKMAETGVRGSSAKHASADAVLAILADRDLSGNVANRRLVIHKLRAGATGREFPFELRSVPVELGSTCVVDWDLARTAANSQKPTRDPWRGNARFLRSAIDVMSDKSKAIRPFGSEGPEVKALDREEVRREFYAAYPADGDSDKARAATRRQAFDRAIKAGVAATLLQVRELEGVTWLWLTGNSNSDK